jgi:hypothetical protein
VGHLKDSLFSVRAVICYESIIVLDLYLYYVVQTKVSYLYSKQSTSDILWLMCLPLIWSHLGDANTNGCLRS